MRKKYSMMIVIASCMMFLVACQNAQNSTPTVAPINTVAPTSEPTKEPTEVPTIPPTETPAPTEEPEPTPTIEPTATPIPSPTPIAGLVVIPTSTPTPLPTELPTPTPTPYVVVDSKLALKFQAGDDIWYQVYKDGTLVVSGTGSTWDFEVNEVSYNFQNDDQFDIHTIVIEEGVNRIGNWAVSCFYGATKVIIPNSLKEVGENGFDGIGWDVGYSEWINLDFDKLKTTNTSFCDAQGLDGIEGVKESMATPTPTPIPATPTPTPVPDPNNPKKIGEQKVTKTASLEYWDDGTIKIVGTGEVNEKQLGKEYPWPSHYIEDDMIGLTREYFDKLVISNGITSIETYALSGFNFNEYYFPKEFNLDDAKEFPFSIFVEDTIHCYYDGKAFTVTFSEHPTAEVTSGLYFEELAQSIKEMYQNNKTVSEPSELSIGYQNLTHGDQIIHLSWD